MALLCAGLVDLTQASAIPKPRPANLQKNGCLVGGLSVSWGKGAETIQWAKAAGASVTDVPGAQKVQGCTGIQREFNASLGNSVKHGLEK